MILTIIIIHIFVIAVKGSYGVTLSDSPCKDNNVIAVKGSYGVTSSDSPCKDNNALKTFD